MNQSSQWLTLVPQDAKDILSTLTSFGHDAVLVGGCVRDLLMGRPVHDFDIATSAPPQEVMERFSHAIPTGLQHGTVTVVKNGCPYEVTTFRVDLGYSDGRRPDAVRFSSSLLEDLKRRDFTINAMALRSTGEFVDPFGGRADITRRVIRAVGNAAERFEEDSLRILRAIRFCAQLGFVVDDATSQAMRVMAPLMKNVSSERIGQELIKIAGSDWQAVLPRLAYEGYFDALQHPFPEFKKSLEDLVQALGMEKRVDNPFQSPDHPAAGRAFPELGQGFPKLELTNGLPEREHAFTENVALHPSVLGALALWVSCGGMTELQIQALFRKLAWPKSWMKSVLRVRRGFIHIRNYQSLSDWKQGMFGGEAYSVWVASVLADWLNGLPLHAHRIETDSESEGMAHRANQNTYRLLCETAYRQMSIHRIQDLVVDGKALQEEGFEGPDIGLTLQLLARAVLSGDVENTPSALMTYAKMHQGGTHDHEQ